MKRSRILKLAAALAEMAISVPECSAQENAWRPPQRREQESITSIVNEPPYRRLGGDEFEMFRLLGKKRPLSAIAFYFSVTPKVAAERLRAIQSRMGCQSLAALRRAAIQWSHQSENTGRRAIMP